MGLPELMAALGVAVLLYPLPSGVAMLRRHPQTKAIVALNLLLGWTVLGWAGAIVWALTEPRHSGVAARQEEE